MKTYLFLFIAIANFCLYSCSSPSAKAEKDKPLLMVSIEPLRFFTEQIAGENFRVETLVKQGSSPETYEPTAKQLMILSRSSAYIQVGNLGFERTWLNRLKENAPNIRISDSSKGIMLLKGEHSHAGETDTDPHTWTSAKNAEIIVRNILETLCEIDSTNSKQYKARAEKLLSRIEKVDKHIIKTLSDQEDRTFMIYHPSLSYFSRDYGLKQLCIEEGGKEPTPAQLKQLIKKCKQSNVKTVFVQQEFSKAAAKLISAETGAKIVEINPLSYSWEKEMLKIAKSLHYGK